MTALALCFDTELMSGDLDTGDSVSETAGDFLNSAIKASLFTNRRDLSEAAGGCWSDALYDESFGSLLWTKQRSKISQALLVELQIICNDALRWLVSGGYLEAIDVAVERMGAHSVVITVTRHNNDGSVVNQLENYTLG